VFFEREGINETDDSSLINHPFSESALQLTSCA